MLARAQRERKNEEYCLELRKHLVLKLIIEFDIIQSDFNCTKERGRVEAKLMEIDRDIKANRNSKLREQPSLGQNNNDLSELKKDYNSIKSALESGVRRLEVGYDSETLQSMVRNAETTLQSHRDRLNDLLSGKSRVDAGSGDDTHKIINLINQNL